MIILIGSFEMESGQADALKSAMTALSTASRKDKGCVMYSWNISAENENIVRLLEVWENEETLKAHLELPHVGVFVEVFVTAKVKRHKINIFDADNMRALGVEFPFPEAPAIW